MPWAAATWKAGGALAAGVVRSAAQLSKLGMKPPLSKGTDAGVHPRVKADVGGVGGSWPGMIWGSSGVPKVVPALARHRLSPSVLYPLRQEPLIFKSPK